MLVATLGSRDDSDDASVQGHRLVRRLMIRCPATGRAVDTGLDMALRPKPVSGTHRMFNCTECAQEHAWRADDVFVD